MSRSGYTEDYDENWQLIMWRGAVASSIRGKRGQAFLRELIEALDAMPEKRLIANDLQADGEVCALGSVGVRRGIELTALDPDDYATLAATFNISAPLVQEIEFMNDDVFDCITPEQRWRAMRRWAVEHLAGEAKS